MLRALDADPHNIDLREFHTCARPLHHYLNSVQAADRELNAYEVSRQVAPDADVTFALRDTVIRRTIDFVSGANGQKVQGGGGAR